MKFSVLALIGNKIDLMEEEQVNYDEAIAYAKVNDKAFFHYEYKTGVRCFISAYKCKRK